MKKTLSILICIVVVIALTACSKQSNTNTTTQVTTTAQQTTAATTLSTTATTESTTSSTTAEQTTKKQSTTKKKSTTTQQNGEMSISVNEALDVLTNYYGSTYNVNGTVQEDNYYYFSVVDKKGVKYASVKVNLNNADATETVIATGETYDFNLLS